MKIIVIKFQDYYVGHNGPTYSYMFYEHKDKNHIKMIEFKLWASAHDVEKFDILKSKLSKKIIKFIDTDVPMHIYIDDDRNMHYTRRG